MATMVRKSQSLLGDPLAQTSKIPVLLREHSNQILSDWLNEQSKTIGRKVDEQSTKAHSQEFLRLLQAAAATGLDKQEGPAWDNLRGLLAEVSGERGRSGFSPSETAMFVFSIKQPLFNLIRSAFAKDPEQLADELWAATTLIDQLGLQTTEAHQKSREEVIVRQQQDMLELSTPVVQLWDGILALPMIGTLDSSRTQVVMESLLEKIMATGSEIAIIDITGVPTVDTLVAQYLIKTVTAARLMGAECIISGIRPQIAATIVHLGVDLAGISTKASLADAFKLALTRTGRTVTKVVAPVRGSHVTQEVRT